MTTKDITGPDLGPSGWCGDPKRGASMGRPSVLPDTFTGKLRLQRIRLDQGGYDKGGAYWGSGNPLYWAGSADGELSYFLRAKDRTTAKARIHEKYPAATYYR